jgi:hypothetical protein
MDEKDFIDTNEINAIADIVFEFLIHKGIKRFLRDKREILLRKVEYNLMRR